MGGWIEYVILILLVLLNAFFSASELAIVTARKTRIKQLADEGSKQARAVLKLSEEPGRFLATIQVGVTMAGFFASAFGAVSLVKTVEGVLKSVSFLAPVAETVAFVGVTVLIALVTLIFGELVPKTLAVEAAESIALTVAGPIRVIERVASPVIAFLTGTTNLIVRLLGGTRKVASPSITQEEVVSMVTTGQEEGIFHLQQQELIRSVFNFSGKQAREVMRPRLDMIMLQADQSVKSVAPQILENEFTRYPVFDGTDRDLITGIVYTKDILRCFIEDKTERPLSEIARSPLFVPDSKQVSELFTQLQSSRTHVAIVVDEYGSIAGLVTLEDLLEELVGDIQDEFDHEEAILEQISPNEYVVRGRTPLYDVNEALKLSLGQHEEGTHREATTLAGLLLAGLKRIPSAGETLRIELPKPIADDDDDDHDKKDDKDDADKVAPAPILVAVILTVLEMDKLRVDKVIIKLDYDHSN